MKKLLFLFFLSAFIFSCRQPQQNVQHETAGYDLPQIKDSGELVVLTISDAMTSYYIYREQEMGYQYEISRLFAESLGLKTRVEKAKNVSELTSKLLAGQGDIIIYHLPISKELKDSLIYCGEESITHQVVVQRNKNPLKDVTELIGKDVYVTPGKYYKRLVNLNNELGGGIHIHLADGDSITTEILISQVSKGQIPYTICDNETARLNATYYPNINIRLAVSFDQRSAWAVRKEAPLLAASANEWYENNRNSSEFKAVIKRYFELNKNVGYSPILSLEGGKISHYDDLFKLYAKDIDWDWRLVAAIAFTESNFNPNAASWAGAKGLMQLMPGTSRAMGIPEGEEHNPAESIRGAVRYMGMLNKSFQTVTDKKERVNFVLAAYNAGIGHVYDAMALAEKYGKNKYVWHGHVEHYLLLKSNEEYYTDPVCKNGYMRGVETYNFVRKINSQYERYKTVIKL